jgi:putative transposase
VQYVLEMTSPIPDLNNPVASLFQRLVSEKFVADTVQELELAVRRRIYDIRTVALLMMLQRLHPKGSLSAVVQNRVELMPTKERSGGRRKISTNTGGYSQARQRMPVEVAEKVNQRIFKQTWELAGEDASQPVFVVDGTTLQLEHRPELVDAFPPGSNQHGENHWPVLRLVGLHDARSGLASRPEWGPFYGPAAVSEQALAQKALMHIPGDAIVLGDSNFGILWFVHAVVNSGRGCLVRLTKSRSEKITKGPVLRRGSRWTITWRASQWDRQAHPELPADAEVSGWFMVFDNPANPGDKLYLFSTLDLTPEQVLELYKLRWNIETDFRSLKQTVRLHRLLSKSVSMAEKELLLGVSAYNLVRAVMYLASRHAGISPRELSFSRVQDAVMVALPRLDAAATDAEYAERLQRLLDIAAEARLPKRKGSRSYPRTIWGRGGHFPYRPNRKASDRTKEVAS